jgi:hypothetical protein
MQDLINYVQQQYGTIFSEPPDVIEVWKKWENVYEQPINPNIIDQNQYMSTNLKKNALFSDECLGTYNDKKRRLRYLISYLRDQYHTIFDKSLHSLEMLKEWVSVFQQLIKPNIIV